MNLKQSPNLVSHMVTKNSQMSCKIRDFYGKEGTTKYLTNLPTRDVF